MPDVDTDSPPFPELSQIVSDLEHQYDRLGSENLGETSFDADARLATVKVLAIIAKELVFLRRTVYDFASKKDGR